MGKNEVEWSLQLKEMYDLCKSMNKFTIKDIVNKSNLNEQIVRKNLSILLGLNIVKAINTHKSIYMFMR